MAKIDQNLGFRVASRGSPKNLKIDHFKPIADGLILVINRRLENGPKMVNFGQFRDIFD